MCHTWADLFFTLCSTGGSSILDNKLCVEDVNVFDNLCSQVTCYNYCINVLT